MDAGSNGSQALRDAYARGIPDPVKAGADPMRERSLWPMPNGMEAAAHDAREAAERFGRTLGSSGIEGERLALQSSRNMEALKQCRAVLTQAFQASSDDWMEMVQGQWKRNFDGMERLMQATSVQEFGAIQGELVRDNLEHVIRDIRSIAERSMQAADEAGKRLSSMTDRGADEAA